VVIPSGEEILCQAIQFIPYFKLFVNFEYVWTCHDVHSLLAIDKESTPEPREMTTSDHSDSDSEYSQSDTT
jgi:hypothetical protein